MLVISTTLFIFLSFRFRNHVSASQKPLQLHNNLSPCGEYEIFFHTFAPNPHRSNTTCKRYRQHTKRYRPHERDIVHIQVISTHHLFCFMFSKSLSAKQKPLQSCTAILAEGHEYKIVLPKKLCSNSSIPSPLMGSIVVSYFFKDGSIFPSFQIWSFRKKVHTEMCCVYVSKKS